MKATPFEYRFRYGIHGLLYALGFWAPWTFYTTALGSRATLWNFGMSELARTRLLSFDRAAVLLLLFGLLFAALGAALRVWGTAYVGSGVVNSRGMHGEALLADGPYRRTRNPLYLGTLLNTFAVALGMPVSGAVFCIVLIWVYQVRLALAEEPFLTARFGEPYRAYAARVPRFLPAFTPRIPAAGAKPHWLQACVGELYVVGVAVTFVVLCAVVAFAPAGEGFDSDLLIKGVLVSLGLSLIARAFLPKPKAASASETVL